MNKQQKIRQQLEYNKVDADLGIEIECETKSKNMFPNVNGWFQERDGSLRGNSVEYVSDPMKFKDVRLNLSNVNEQLDKLGIKLYKSIRAGVHVHINCLEHTPEEVAKVVALYAFFERSLLNFCGRDREYNLFCLPLVDSENVIQAVNEGRVGGYISHFRSNMFRYCALNVSSLAKHGTLEFRSMETRPNLEGIADWVELLQTIYEKALGYNDIYQMLEEFSMGTPQDFANSVLGNRVKMLKTKDEWLIEGMRVAQDICY